MTATRPTPSEELLRFTAQLPHERDSLLQFALRVAEELPAGSRLIDVGAGNSPYRELFDHLHYESTDWEHSVHPGARAVDHVGPAHDLPVPDESYDAVLVHAGARARPQPRRRDRRAVPGPASRRTPLHDGAARLGAARDAV